MEIFIYTSNGPKHLTDPFTFFLMKRRMFFKIGVSLIIAVAIILFYVDVDEDGDQRHYHRKSISGYGQYKVLVENEKNFLLEEALIEIKAYELTKKGDLNQDINKLIDREQNDVITHLRLRRESIDTASSTEETNDSGIVTDTKDEFYYDNSVPINDDIERRLFNPIDEKPVFSRNFVSRPKSTIHLSVVVCENRANEALTMLKSAAMVTTDMALTFHIVADKQNQPVLQKTLESWPEHFHKRTAYHIYNVAFPRGRVTLNAWSNLYKPCASQRLFLPDRLRSLDSLIYVDTDTVILQSLSSLWSTFSQFNSSQLVGLVQESEDGSAGWYNRFASHPYYGSYGLNSGVMLMNMTKLRQRTKWLSVLQDDYEKYRLSMTWGDQDLINIFFSTRPELVYVLPCNWNYRADHCMYTSNCKHAEKTGVSLLHASRGAFYDNKEPVFFATHQSFHQFDLAQDIKATFMPHLKQHLNDAKGIYSTSSCKEVTDLFLTQLLNQFESKDTRQKQQMQQIGGTSRKYLESKRKRFKTKGK